jgi:hypothetical protein
MVDRYRITDTDEVLTRDELRQRLNAELDAMDPETRAANCNGTVDDLIADSALVGIYERVDEEQEQSVAIHCGDLQQRAELAAELGYAPASLAPDDIERHRRLNAAVDRAPTRERIVRKYAHLREGMRCAEIETDGRSEVADLYE